LCHFGDMNHSPCMLLLDSLLDAGPKRLENDIRRFKYVTSAFKVIKRTTCQKLQENMLNLQENNN
jgi:hypothetical protein